MQNNLTSHACCLLETGGLNSRETVLMEYDGFFEHPNGSVGIAKIPHSSAFTRSVLQFFRDGQSSLVVLYRFFDGGVTKRQFFRGFLGIVWLSNCVVHVAKIVTSAPCIQP